MNDGGDGRLRLADSMGVLWMGRAPTCVWYIHPFTDIT